MEFFTTPKGTELPFLDLRGKSYLQIAFRLVWMREEHPDWSITTEPVTLDAKYALFKATITDNNGRVLATAHGREDYAHFADAIEKSETKAVGRALAMCGYGTQFAPELDEQDRIADSPIEKKKSKPEAIKPKTHTASQNTQYIIPFGKFKGLTIEAIPLPDLNNYMNYIEAKAKEENKPITGQIGEFMNRADDWIKLNTMNNSPDDFNESNAPIGIG